MLPPTNPPRWFKALSKTLAEKEKVSAYQVATVGPDTHPHVRTHIHRGFLSSKSHPSLPLLLTSTDIRTPKVVQILQNPFVEVCWWLDPSQEQFRIAARATLIPAPTDALYAVLSSRLSLLARGTFESGEVDWEAKRRAMFDEMSGHMKASWARPPPGTAMPGSGGYDEAKKWPERLPKLGEAKDEKEKELVERALANFALVVLEPFDVDYVEMAMLPNQRTRFVRKDVEDDWVEEILVP